MARERKEHDERIIELLNISERLFIKDGYEDTSVSDIINEAGIAKGTFYHYFESKESLLDALLIIIVDEIQKDLNEIVARDDLDAVEKLLGISAYMANFAKGKEKIIDYIHEERNDYIHLKVERLQNPAFIELYTKIIRQGIEEGLFETEFPVETAIALFAAVSAIGERKHDHAGRKVLDPQMIRAVIDISERLLGARDGLFDDYLKRMEDLK